LELSQKGKFTIPNGRKGKAEFTDSRVVQVKIGSEPGFTQAYELLKSIAAVRKDSAGLKRKRNEEETVGESSTGKKARKQAEEDADEL